MTITNKRLLISESGSDSNQCTPSRGKPDQHGTYASHVSLRMPDVRFPRAVLICDNLSRVIDRFEQIHYPWEGGLSTQSTTRWLIDLRVRTQFLSHNSQWRSGKKLSLCRWQSTRLTEPISPACNQYIQYLLTGVNPSVLNQHRWGLQLWRCRFSTFHSPTLLTNCLPFSPKGPAQHQVINQFITIWAKGRSDPKSREWEPPLDFYRNLSSKHSMS
jgi:hypothetical protein